MKIHWSPLSLTSDNFPSTLFESNSPIKSLLYQDLIGGTKAVVYLSPVWSLERASTSYTRAIKKPHCHARDGRCVKGTFWVLATNFYEQNAGDRCYLPSAGGEKYLSLCMQRFCGHTIRRCLHRISLIRHHVLGTLFVSLLLFWLCFVYLGNIKVNESYVTFEKSCYDRVNAA